VSLLIEPDETWICDCCTPLALVLAYQLPNHCLVADLAEPDGKQVGGGVALDGQGPEAECEVAGRREPKAARPLGRQGGAQADVLLSLHIWRWQ
jgi:hypothetical protein